MIYGTFTHRIRRGHWFVPHLHSYDKYGQYYDGCELCILQDPVQAMRDAHNEGICPKQIEGQSCLGRPGECGTHAVS